MPMPVRINTLCSISNAPCRPLSLVRCQHSAVSALSLVSLVSSAYYSPLGQSQPLLSRLYESGKALSVSLSGLRVTRHARRHVYYN